MLCSSSEVCHLKLDRTKERECIPGVVSCWTQQQNDRPRAGQQPSPPRPRAVLVPGMLLSPSAEAEAGEESTPWILGRRLRQYVPKDLALMQPHLRAEQS